MLRVVFKPLHDTLPHDEVIATSVNDCASVCIEMATDEVLDEAVRAQLQTRLSLDHANLTFFVEEAQGIDRERDADGSEYSDISCDVSDTMDASATVVPTLPVLVPVPQGVPVLEVLRMCGCPEDALTVTILYHAEGHYGFVGCCISALCGALCHCCTHCCCHAAKKPHVAKNPRAKKNPNVRKNPNVKRSIKVEIDVEAPDMEVSSSPSSLPKASINDRNTSAADGSIRAPRAEPASTPY